MKTQNHRSRAAFAVALLAGLAVAITSCVDSDEPISVEPVGGTLFDRYVAMGNSLTAGFQSGGININTQRQAYPVELAAKADAPFGIPGLAPPGCPPLLVGPLTTVRTDTIPCGLRLYGAPDVVQNVAVPGAATAHLGATLGTGTILNTLILGGRTQISAMQAAAPTLVSVWIGNNDVLGAALHGDTTLLTSTTAFQAAYDEVAGAIDATDAQDAILIGVVDILAAAPVLQPGAYFWALPDTIITPTDTVVLDVDDSCAPSAFGGVGDTRLLSFIGVADALAAGEDPLVMDCVNGIRIGGAYEPDYMVDQTEAAVIRGRIAAFNAYIVQYADDNGWIYVDPTSSLVMPALNDPDRLRKCQNLAMATDPASFAAAVQTSCPVDLDPGTSLTFFGSYVSFDGFHMSSAFHDVVADTLAGRLNAKHGLSLPVN